MSSHGCPTLCWPQGVGVSHRSKIAYILKRAALWFTCRYPPTFNGNVCVVDEIIVLYCKCMMDQKSWRHSPRVVCRGMKPWQTAFIRLIINRFTCWWNRLFWILGGKIGSYSHGQCTRRTLRNPYWHRVIATSGCIMAFFGRGRPCETCFV